MELRVLIDELMKFLLVLFVFINIYNYKLVSMNSSLSYKHKVLQCLSGYLKKYLTWVC